MKVKNTAARLWMVDGHMLIPDQVVELDERYRVDLKDNKDIEFIEERAKPGPKPKQADE